MPLPFVVCYYCRRETEHGLDWHAVNCPVPALIARALEDRPGASFAFVRFGQQVGIRCLNCDRVSWNEHDVEQRYCGACHVFHPPRSTP